MKKNTAVSRDRLVDIMRLIISGTLSQKELGKLCKIVSNNVPHPDWTNLFFYPPISCNFRSPEDIVDIALAYEPVKVNVPLLDRLKQLEQQATQKFNFQPVRCFDHIGFAWFSEIKKSGYWCSPENSAEFASTGGDGHHFSFMVENNSVTEQSPIILTQPDMGDRLNVIVGENLFDFLCFGMHCAYFHILGVLDYPDDREGHWFGDDTWEEQKAVLHFLTEELDLQPWINRHRRFAELQDRFLPLLKLPPDEI